MNESQPTLSLIKYLEKDRHGFALDLEPPTGDRQRSPATASRLGPYAQTIRSAVLTDAGDRLQELLLIIQRDRYDTIDAGMVRPTNRVIEAAWQAAYAFHRQRPGEPASAIHVNGQDGAGEHGLPFQSLFYCQQARIWFHPVCPQCGLELNLCRDDALLASQGLGTYSGSLDRFMYCRACAPHAAAPSFYVREKMAGQPASVHDVNDLIRHWQSGPVMQSAKKGFPCGRCAHAGGCAGSSATLAAHIQPFAFYPFYMLMVPAPSCSAEAFLGMLAGDESAGLLTPAGDPAAIPRPWFLFQGHERWFLELLYLKLTFLDQVCRRFMAGDAAGRAPEMVLGLDGVGVDITPGGAGLPALWNFNVRVLDAVGSTHEAPFAPLMPEAPRFYFLGSLWFRTLLVNVRQGADVVFGQVGAWIGPLPRDARVDSLSIDMVDPADVLAPGQIFWTPDSHPLPSHWQRYWTQALRLGAQLVHAGLKSGVDLDPAGFLSTLASLREAVRAEMFSASPVQDVSDGPVPATQRLREVLQGILVKWEQAAEIDKTAPEAVPEPPVPPLSDATILITPLAAEATLTPAAPAAAGPLLSDGAATLALPTEPALGSGLDETVVFSPTDSLPPGPPPPAADSGGRGLIPPASPDNADTVILPRDPNGNSPGAGNGDAGEQTVLLSPSLSAPKNPAVDQEDPLAATIHQRAAQPSVPAGGSGDDDDLEATLVLNGGGVIPPAQGRPTVGDDLAATVIQRGERPESSPPPRSMPPAPGTPAAPQAQTEDLEATLVISPNGSPSVPRPFPQAEPSSPSVTPEDDDLAQTLIETPRRPDSSASEPKTVPPPPPLPGHPPAVPPTHFPEKFTSEDPEDDDSVIEQTVIIRSDVRKE